MNPRSLCHAFAMALVGGALALPGHAVGPIFVQVLFKGAGLESTYDVAISPDGAYVYAFSAVDCLTVFTRDDAAGTLSFQRVRCHSEASLGGLDNGFTNAGGLTISPDGEHLYTAGGTAVGVFDRDTTTGDVSFIAELVDGIGGVVGIDQPFDLVLSPDGSFAYVADRSGAVAVFARDPLTGGLSFVEAHFDDTAGVDGIGEARGLALSPGAEHLYVASGTNVENSLAVFSRDAGTGALTFVQSLFDGVGGVDGLDAAADVVVSPDGEHVYVAAEEDDSVTVFARDAGTGMLTFVQALFDGVGGITRLADARGIAMRPDGSIVTVTSQGNNAVVVFARDSMSGMLTLVEEGTNVSLGASGIRDPIAVVFDPVGDHTYVAARDAAGPGGVVVLGSAPATGAQTFVEYANNSNRGLAGLGNPTGSAVSADGDHVYVADSTNAVSVWSREAATGRMSFIEVVDETSPGVSSLCDATAPTLSPDGAHLYVSAPEDPLLVVFSRDATTGQLTFASDLVPEAAGAVRAMTLSADGLFLYAVENENDSVQVYSRDPVTGALMFEQALVDGIGAEGIANPSSVALAPGDAHLYVAGTLDDAIARFTRNGATGLLTFVDTVTDGVGGVDGLDGVAGLASSPDGAYLYSASLVDSAVTVFARDGGSGALTFLESRVDGVGGVDGLAGAGSVRVSPDGELVLIGSRAGDNALALFLRDSVNGRLRFESLDRGLDTSENAVGSLTISPDGAHVILTHSNTNPDAVTVFGLPEVIFADGFESGDTTRWPFMSP